MRLLLVFLLVIYSSVFAEVVIAPNKVSALQNCQEKANASPKALRKEMLSSCQCIVKHTDFRQVAPFSQEKKTQELQKLYQQANEVCLSK